MAGKFAKFVEWCTDSRYVPRGSCCALCGQKLGFFRTGFWSVNAGKLADGVLCEKCTARVEKLVVTKREWLKASELRQASWQPYNKSNWSTMPLHVAKDMIAAKERVDQACLASFGSDKTSLFRMEDAIRVEPTALQVGIARAKRLHNKVIVYGAVERGSFARNDVVRIEREDGADTATILEAYVRDNDETTIELCLRANMGKHQLRAGESGWLVLDYEKDVAVGCVIVG